MRHPIKFSQVNQASKQGSNQGLQNARGQTMSLVFGQDFSTKPKHVLLGHIFEHHPVLENTNVRCLLRRVVSQGHPPVLYSRRKLNCLLVQNCVLVLHFQRPHDASTTCSVCLSSHRPRARPEKIIVLRSSHTSHKLTLRLIVLGNQRAAAATFPYGVRRNM